MTVNKYLSGILSAAFVVSSLYLRQCVRRRGRQPLERLDASLESYQHDCPIGFARIFPEETFGDFFFGA